MPDVEVVVLSTSPIANLPAHFISKRQCPRRGSSYVYRRPRRNVVDALLYRVFDRNPYYCDAWDMHFYAKRGRFSRGRACRTNSVSRDRCGPEAEVLTYSRAKGLFGGVSLEGSTLRPDNDANKRVYGKDIAAKDIVLEGAVKTPPSAGALISTLNKASPAHKTA